MTEPARERGGSWAGAVLRLPFAALSAVADGILSRRGLGVVFLLVAAGLATAGWLRPPLSQDVSGLHIPLGTEGSGPPAEELLRGAGPVPWDGVGVCLLAVIAVGLVLILMRPAFLGPVAGLLLAGALAANAATACNHPELIELLESEREQREHIALVLGSLRGDRAVTRADNGPPDPWIQVSDFSLSKGHEAGAGLLGSGPYLGYGWWLVFWSAGGLLLGTGRFRERGAYVRPGSFSARLVYLAFWLLAGVGLAGLACHRRLHAEYLWLQAEGLEQRGDPAGARAALDEAVARFPALGRLERTWLLAGKLDFHAGRPTPAEIYFRAVQHAGAREWPQALALTEDLLAGPAADHPAVRRLAARTFLLAGLAPWMQPAEPLPADRVTEDSLSRLAASQGLWERALDASPRRDAAFCLGAARAFVDRESPERAEAAFEPVLENLADPFVRADVLALLADAHFEAGNLEEARRLYAASFDALNLPQRKNYPAQKGLGGL